MISTAAQTTAGLSPSAGTSPVAVVPKNWADCLTALGVAQADPTAVIEGVTYEGHTADVIVRATGSSDIDVWVVATGCSGTNTELLDHEVRTS